MQSIAKHTVNINLPVFNGHHKMIPFDLRTLKGVPSGLVSIVRTMLTGIKASGTAFFTMEGKTLKKGQTLRRGGAHIDGNYEPHAMTFGKGGGNGWLVGQDGRAVDHPIHKRQYLAINGGIILASNYSACNGWIGQYDGEPNTGGDCTHMQLGESFKLPANEVWYGNNHFIHESLPVESQVDRTFARITLPESHNYE